MTDTDERLQTLSSFDWQWTHLAAGDFMPGDRWFDANAARVLARELCALDPAWFRGKRILDAGCGQGRWSRALLELGANVTAIDYSQAGLERTTAVCGDHPHLRTRRVNLLELPADLSRERFDLVFSFGVLHHTGDTWRALDNVASLVDESGALFLYLYGSTSWDATGRSAIERTRRELADMSFDAKVAELRRRYPEQDPHQLFDLLSPVINDRVTFDEVAARLKARGFDQIVQTISTGEVYLRATRPSFPTAALSHPVGESSDFVRESGTRWSRRDGAAFEAALRARLNGVRPRPIPASARQLFEELGAGSRVLDTSLPPERATSTSGTSRYELTWSPARSPTIPGALTPASADAVISLGASLGACRHPDEYLRDLWYAVARGGVLIVELPDVPSMRARRTLLERLLDARRPVPDKVRRLLSRHSSWCSGDALYAIGGPGLLNPLAPDEATAILRREGATRLDVSPARTGTLLVTARAPS
jgi:SAM-dependent methyltransferase